MMTTITTTNRLLYFFILSLLIPAWVNAQADSFSVGEILIKEDSSAAKSPIVSTRTFKTESVSQDKFDDPFRQSLSDLVKDQVGVDTQVYCANCGAKRLTINGLKGEHTSILIDGLPLHSAVSSFYGVDSVPLLGLRKVEVMRGAGASLSNPEAIGGTLNLITVDPLDFTSKLRTNFGVNDKSDRQSQNYNFLSGKTSEDKSWGIVIGGSFTRNETWDEDENKVAELPQREGKSFLAKGRWQNSTGGDVSLRVGYSDLEILGGFHNPTKPSRVRPTAAGESDFVNGDVERPFIGDPAKITDWVNLERIETAFTGSQYFGEDTLLEFKAGYARQEQKAIYQHGFDYAHIDNSFVGDLSFTHFLNDTMSVKAGVFGKDERLRSASQSLFERYVPTDPNDIKKDNFDYASKALYTELSYLGEEWEWNFSLRADRIDINWLELTNEIGEWVLAPRFNLLQNINEHLSQRFSYGLGYRAPLTFFESGHGNEENGYEVAITQLEKAHSLVYNLSYNTPEGYVTGGVHYTHLKNMAFGFEQFNQPIKYRNSELDFDILVADLLVGYKIKEHWLIEGSLEMFEYQSAYKRRLPTAAIEKRIGLKSTLDTKEWTHVFSAQYVPSRKLGNYGRYYDHLQRRNQALEPILDSSLPQKDQEAPGFFQFDTHFFYNLREDMKVSLSIQNILDYTQASAGDSPSTWHWHFNHAHYDGLHTWGPNAGRQFSLGFEYQF
ncbi:MAG: TonB-dependent receptor [Halobacteriovoraceae bacterium]|nr:TonB-dependent receptor [Halobacteriovoraceae bacterium]